MPLVASEVGCTLGLKFHVNGYKLMWQAKSNTTFTWTTGGCCASTETRLQDENKIASHFKPWEVLPAQTNHTYVPVFIATLLPGLLFLANPGLIPTKFYMTSTKRSKCASQNGITRPHYKTDDYDAQKWHCLFAFERYPLVRMLGCKLSRLRFQWFITASSLRFLVNIVTYKSTAKQRLFKHIPAGRSVRNNRASIT
jgi:hypothetical protein